MKNATSILTVGLLLTACGDPGASEIKQRDVYHSLEDCVADWGEVELCERQIAQAKADAEKNKQTSSSSSVPAFIFFGPSYTGSDRYVAHNGRTYVPSTTRAVSTGHFTGSNPTPVYRSPTAVSATVTPHSSSVTSTVRSPSATAATTSRSGFGATGSAVSSGSS